MGHPDFRVRGKVFATLGYPDDRHGMVRLTPDQQADCVESDPASFAPSAGAWGRGGSTTVLLKTADPELVRRALAAAWRKAAPKSVGEARPGGKRPRPAK